MSRHFLKPETFEITPGCCPSFQTICHMPICVYGREEVFSRVYDLKRHVVRTQPDDACRLPADFFSEPNRFWLPLWPSDYKLLVAPTSVDTEAALCARSLVIDWVVRVSLPSRVLQSWQDGWDGKPSEPPQKRQHIEQQRYSPSCPSVSTGDLAVVEIQVINGKFIAHLLTGGSTWLEVVISSEISDFPKCLQALTRRMTIPVDVSLQNLRPTSGGTQLRGQLLTATKNAISPSLGIHAGLVESVTERSSADSGFATPIPCSETPLATPVHGLSPLAYTNSLPHPFPVMSHIKVVSSSASTVSNSGGVTACSVIRAITSTPAATIAFRPITSSTQDVSPPAMRYPSVRMPVSTGSPSSPVQKLYQPIVDIITSRHSLTATTLPSASVSQSVGMETSVPQVNLPPASTTFPPKRTVPLDEPIAEPVVPLPRPTSVDHESSLVLPTEPTNIPSSSPVPSSDTLNIRQRGDVLLRTGGMSLFAPAQRQWDQEEGFDARPKTYGNGACCDDSRLSKWCNPGQG